MNDTWNNPRLGTMAPRRDATHPTMDQIRAAAAREQRMAKVRTVLGGLLFLVCVSVIVGGTCFGIRAYRRHQADLMRQQEERLKAEQVRAEEQRRQREEAAARLRQEQELKAKAVAEQRRQQEMQRADREKARVRVADYRAKREKLRAATIDNFRNADDVDRPGKVTVETLFLCLFPNDAAGEALYQVQITPGTSPTASRLHEDRDPEPIAEEVFTELSASMPYLIVRDARGNGKSYLVYPKKAPRPSRAVKVPQPGVVFNPSKADFGPLYDTVKALGATRTSFGYQVEFRGQGLPSSVVLPRTYSFGGEVDRTAVESAVKRALVDLPRTDKTLAATPPPLDRVLASGTLTFRQTR